MDKERDIFKYLVDYKHCIIRFADISKNLGDFLPTKPNGGGAKTTMFDKVLKELP